MLQHIKEDLLEKLTHYKFQQDDKSHWAKYAANELLDMIEGFGMLPPRLPNVNTFDLAMGRDYNKWEEE